MIRWCLIAGLVGGIGAGSLRAQDSSPAKAQTAPATESVLDLVVKDIDGNEVDLEKYRGQVALVVNVASECGLTKQYAGLEALHDKYSADGLVVLGFPCNQFGGQEPGDEKAIKSFCQTKYDVSFPMFSKVSVNGDDRNELYERLTSIDTSPVGAGDISWNFEKFLIDRSGKVIARFAPRTAPDDAKLVEAIEKALAEK